MSDDVVDLGIDDLIDAVEVGAGGFGTVYRARQESLRRDVAVKVVSNTVKDRKVRIRFEREIQAMGMLSGHPNIVTVYDSGFTGKGQPYILMDYMEGGSLADRLDSDGPVPHTDVLQMMVKVCGALETAHQAGILHRDLKPENILVSAYGEPKLGDFGIARLKGGPETGTASLTASIEHVAPELLAAEPPDASTDLYALGSTMYKLLTDEAAFVHSSDQSIVPALTRIKDEPVPDLRQKGFPSEVADIVERAMAKARHDRFASAMEMGQVIREVQERLGLPVTSLPIREDDAAAVRESTRTINSDDIARSIEGLAGIRGTQSGPVPEAPGATPPAGPGVGSTPAPPAGWNSQPVTQGQPPGRPRPPPQQVPQYATGPQYAGGPPAQGPTGQPFAGSAPQPSYPYSQAPPAASTTPWGKIVAGIGALALVAGLGVFALTRDDGGETVVVTTPTASVSPSSSAVLDSRSEGTVMSTPTPRETLTGTPVPDADQPYVSFERLRDDTDTITIDVPRPWTDTTGAPWVINGDEVGRQIEAAPDLDGFRTTWGQPGVIFGVSDQLRTSFDPGQLLDQFDFTNQCTFDGRTEYSDPAYTGFRDDYSNCGSTNATYTLVAAEPPEQDAILLLQFQQVEDRDAAALDKAIETFFILPEATPSPSESQ